MKERKTTVHDARLFRAGLRVCQTFVDMDPPKEGRNIQYGVERYEIDGRDDTGDVMRALRNEVNVGKRDMNALWRAARKARAIRKRGG